MAATEHLGLRITVPVKEGLQKVAALEDRSVSKVVTRALSDFLKSYDFSSNDTAHD